jgi:hypothetical protein
MAPSVKTEEADGLARKLAQIRGVERLAAIEEAAANVARHLADLRPVTKEEWDAINDDTD